MLIPSVEGFKDLTYEIRLGHARLISVTLNYISRARIQHYMVFRVLVYPSHMCLYMDKRYGKIDAWV